MTSNDTKASSHARTSDDSPAQGDVILVTGATGMVGGQVVRQLHDQYGDRIEIRALVRNPKTAAIPDGIRAVRGDLSDPESLTRPYDDLPNVLDGVTKVFLVWPTMAADEVAVQVIGLLASRVERIVYLSSEGAAVDEPGDPINRSHARLEQVIREAGTESGTNWTFVRGGGFARNDLAWVPAIPTGVVSEAFAGWARSLVHEADLAAVGVRALVGDDLVNTATGALTGPAALTQTERVAILAQVTGQSLRFEETPLEQARAEFEAWLPPDAVDDTIAAMQAMTQQPEPVTGEVERILGRPALTRSDLGLLEEIADHLALALRTERRYQRRSDVADALQASLLPRALPEVAGLEVGVGYHPATAGVEVGGDFYDIFECQGGWGLVLGDVCGKGEEAAAVTAMVRHGVRLLGLWQTEPAELLHQVNHAMVTRQETDRFVTAISAYLTWQRWGARVRLATAGHPRAAVLRADGGVQLGSGGGVPLGVFADAPVAVEDIDLACGDALLLYSDGVTEARGPGGELYDEERLAGALARSRGKPAPALVAAIEKDLYDHSTGRTHDDIALLAVRVREPRV